MQSIQVLLTVHKPNGKCNTTELYHLLENLRPEYIFEEISPSRYDYYYVECKRCSLESITIKKYANEYGVEHIPVDKDGLPGLEIKKELVLMFDVIFDNPEYEQLYSTRFSLTGQYGFAYLNSSQFNEISQRIQQLEKLIIRESGSYEIQQTYDTWLKMNIDREKTIVDNIIRFSIHNKFKNAILLIGAEHRTGILENANKRVNKLNWLPYKFN